MQGMSAASRPNPHILKSSATKLKDD
jgi:hypothetical protein